MQLTDAEIREILVRKKKEKQRRLKRRRRNTLLILLLIIIIIFVLVKVIGHVKDSDKDSDVPAEANRGVIFIDPGHGGMDSGSDDDNGRYEKDDTLRLSLAFRDALEAKGFQVHLSRSKDEEVDRKQRGKMANECGAQLFVSVHRNKANGDGHGVEGFIPKKDAEDSRLLGENIMEALGRAGFAERTIRAGTLNSSAEDYEELAATKMPSVLIEVGFLSSPIDNDLFDKNLRWNAQVMANAVNRTFIALYEPDKAEDFAKTEAAATESAVKAVDRTKQALDGAIEATLPDPDESPVADEDDGPGLDPES